MSFLINYLKKIKLFLLGDFNINLSNYDIHQLTNEFLDSLFSYYFLPYILQPSRGTSNFKTLDNIFTNVALPDINSISGHLPQFHVALNAFFNSSNPKSNKCEKD